MTSSVARRLRQVDVVVAHFALYIFPVLPLLRIRQVPLVVHFHGPWEAEYIATGGRPYGLTSHAKRVIERTVYRQAEAVVVLSVAFKLLVTREYGIEAGRVYVVPPGVQQTSEQDADFLTDSTKAPEGRYILCVRRLVPRMGVETLLHAWAKIETDARLIVVGDGPLRNELEALSGELELRKSVKFLGRVEEGELRNLYRHASLSVIPSHELEGFGLVALESYSCGTPVIATRVGGLAEVIGELSAELLVQPGDSEELSTTIDAVLAGRISSPSPDDCRAHARKYTWSGAARRLNTIYREAAKSPVAKRNSSGAATK